MKLENNGKALPILSFPCTTLMGVKTDELVQSAELQAKGMKAVADRTDAAASVRPRMRTGWRFPPSARRAGRGRAAAPEGRQKMAGRYGAERQY